VDLELPDITFSDDAPIRRTFSETIRAGVKMLSVCSRSYPIHDAAHAFPNVEVLRLLTPDRISLWGGSNGRFSLAREVGLTNEREISIWLYMMDEGERKIHPDVLRKHRQVEVAFRSLLDSHIFPSLKLIRCCVLGPPINEAWWPNIMQDLTLFGELS
jgi:hypothetical protein